MEPGSPARDREIDTLRGIACILLVSYHVVGATRRDGLHLATGPLRVGEDLLSLLRMPLFTFLSGYVYARSPLADHSAWRFLKDKLRRLIVPMLVVGTVFAWVQGRLGGHHDAVNWRWLHVIPVGHYWFVEALFLIFVLVVMLERLQLLSSPGKWLVCWCVAAVLHLTPLDLEWLSIGGAFFLLPFFLLGLYCQRFGSVGAGPLSHMPQQFNAAVSISILIAMLMAYHLAQLEDPWQQPVALLFSCCACVLMLAARLRSRTIAWIGAYSYSIYLLHVFFSAGSRVALSRLDVHSTAILFTVGLLAGVLLPIGADRLFSRWRATRVLVLGRR